MKSFSVKRTPPDCQSILKKKKMTRLFTLSLTINNKISIKPIINYPSDLIMHIKIIITIIRILHTQLHLL